jgi:Xaa-Pro aminopeptidase
MLLRGGLSVAPLDVVRSSSVTGARERLACLRRLLADRQLDGYLINSTDEHLSEYLPEARARRAWLSGFTGSAGELLVGLEQSWLFVDSRYWEQADKQVDVQAVGVCKLGLAGHKGLIQTLKDLGQVRRASGRPFRLGLDPLVIAVEQWRTFERQLRPVEVEVSAVAGNLADRARTELEGGLPALWSERLIFAVGEAVAGQSAAQKLAAVRAEIERAGATVLPVTRLDQVAWLLNLRGWDVPFNPVFIAYAVVTRTESYLFTAPERLDGGVRAALPAEVRVMPYEAYGEILARLSAVGTQAVLVDVRQTTMGTLGCLGAAEVVEADHPIEKLKAHKNTAEIASMQRANLQASRAKTRALAEVMRRFAAGEVVSERDVAEAVERCYREEPDFQGLSFNPIAGIGAHSSIVHYSTPDPGCPMTPGALLLLDSGAQYTGGTTDDTRTVVAGTPDPEQVRCYTEVLKAHINCAAQRFPKGTTGAQLDGITRANLWCAGLEYGHGTGHGVGAFLSVHEGPVGINKRAREELQPGMVTSIEPGYYRPGWGGVRIENLYVVREVEKADGTVWYGFEPLTFIPFDARLIDLDRLDERQRGWLAHYNRAVYERLCPDLDPQEVRWLAEQCRFGLESSTIAQ